MAANNVISIYNRQNLAPAQQPQAFSGSYFADFVAWIDRSEKTTKTYLTNLRQFMAWMKYAGISNPARSDIISYRDWLTAEHDAIQLDAAAPEGWSYRTDSTGRPVKVCCKGNTAAQYLRSVTQFFKWTATSGLYPDIAANVHAPRVKRGAHKKDALTAHEVLEVENSIEAQAAARMQAAQEAQKDTAGRMQRSTEQGKRLFAIYQLAVNAGLRTVEISRANVKDLETKGAQAWLYIWGKGHSEADQRKPLAPEVAAAIKDYLSSRTDNPTGTSPLFVSTGNRSGGQRIAPTTISTMLKKALQQAGFDSERLTAHSLRHTAGRRMMEVTGNNLFLTQHYMRHSNPATTEIYLTEIKDEESTALARQLYDYYHGTSTGSSREKLEQLLDRLTAQQVEQLAGIAAAMR